jgi:photosystem II stability/assembly factor-like uncharacterized protein
VLAEDDWVCQKAHGCQGRLLATSDGGVHWRVTYIGARGMHLYPVRGSRVLYAMTGARMLESTDAGLHWRTLSWPPAIVSFVTPAHGWKLGPARTLAHPPALLETRDGGRTWTTRSDPCAGDYGLPAALSFGSATSGWIVCNTQATAGYQGKEIPDGHGWLLQGRGYMLITTNDGHTWQHSPLTKRDAIAGQSADLLSDTLGFVLLRGCTVRLVRTDLAAASATTLERWNSPTQC